MAEPSVESAGGNLYTAVVIAHRGMIIELVVVPIVMAGRTAHSFAFTCACWRPQLHWGRHWGCPSPCLQHAALTPRASSWSVMGVSKAPTVNMRGRHWPMVLCRRGGQATGVPVFSQGGQVGQGGPSPRVLLPRSRRGEQQGLGLVQGCLGARRQGQFYWCCGQAAGGAGHA